jgi:hypothetical protein
VDDVKRCAPEWRETLGLNSRTYNLNAQLIASFCFRAIFSLETLGRGTYRLQKSRSFLEASPLRNQQPQRGSSLIGARRCRGVPAPRDTAAAVAIRSPLAVWEPQVASKAANTLRAYRADWNHFTAWCAAHEQASLPVVPETVAYYLTALAGSHKPATLVRRLTAISKAHRVAGHPLPASTQHACVREILKGIKRTVGTAQPGKEPLFTIEIRKMIDALPGNLQNARDRALLVIGFAGRLPALRTSRTRCGRCR